MTGGSPITEAQRPPGFVYREEKKGLLRRSAGRSLYCDDIAISKLAEHYGTPLYVYSASMLTERFDAFDRAFRHMPHTICYSVKANSNLNILRLLAKRGSGFYVVSGGELERVLVAERRAANNVSFSVLANTPEEIPPPLTPRFLPL